MQVSGGSDSPSATPNRLVQIDGLRAVAALMVVVYHHIVRWAPPEASTSLYVYGRLFQNVEFLSLFGRIGVCLFFCISGFVISITLLRSSGIVDFLARRFARLWPALALCALISTLTQNFAISAWTIELWPARWQVTPFEFFVSVLFLPPSDVGPFFGVHNAHWIDGVYWTIFSEVRFYILAAVLVLAGGKSRFLNTWCAVQIASTVYDVALVLTPTLHGSLFVQGLLQPSHLPFFTTGVCAYYWREGNRSIFLVVAMVAALFAAFFGDVINIVRLDARTFDISFSVGILMAYLSAIMPMALYVLGFPLLRVLENKYIVLIGLASYPLYLLHERFGIILSRLLAEAGLPGVPAMLLAVTLVIGLSVGMHRYVEEPARAFLIQATKRNVSKLQSDWRSFRFKE